jgi:hypothetical protein
MVIPKRAVSEGSACIAASAIAPMQRRNVGGGPEDKAAVMPHTVLFLVLSSMPLELLRSALNASCRGEESLIEVANVAKPAHL